MSLQELTSADAVRVAMTEFDELGREAFLAKYGFGPSRRYFIQEDGKRYDSKAIVGAAFGFQHPARGPMSHRDFDGGEATVKPRLEMLGFTVVDMGEVGVSNERSTPGRLVDEAFVHRVVAEADQGGRLQGRREAAAAARELLDGHAGQMSDQQFRALFRLFNTDVDDGRTLYTRFLPGFSTPIANMLLSSLDDLNSWTQRLWRGTDEEAEQGVAELLRSRTLLRGAGASYPTMLLYVRDPRRWPVWGPSLDRGLRHLVTGLDHRGPGAGTFDDYRSYASGVRLLTEDLDVPPELFDFVLAEAARQRPRAASDGGTSRIQSLVEAFQRFQTSAQGRYVARARRVRAEELQALLSDPASVSLDWFNNEVWRLDSGTKVRGQVRRLDAEGVTASEEEFVDLEAALDAGEIEFHGNTMFRSATNVFGSQLTSLSDEEKLAVVRDALEILNSDLAPLEKVRQVQALRGFGPNNASGLGMIFHPDSIAIYNAVSKKVLGELGLAVDSLDAFETSAMELKESLGAVDFLELDWFIWLLAQQDDSETAVAGEASGATALAAVLSELLPESSEATGGSLHLVVKWSSQLGADTVDRHREVAERAGAVWWGLFTQDSRWRVSESVVAKLRRQLAEGEPTFAFLSGPTYWRTSLSDVQYSRDAIDEDLLPPSYSSEVPAGSYHLWVKLASFEESDRETLLRDLDPETKRGKPVALSNQTNPLYVRLRSSPRFWWVNQGASYVRAKSGGYIWAPLLDKLEKPRDYWNTMRHLRVGDVVLNYSNGKLRAVSRVAAEARSSQRPDPIADQTWSNDGLRAELDYHVLPEPVPLTKIPTELRQREGGPFRRDGAVNEGYLFPLSDEFIRQTAVALTEGRTNVDEDEGVVAERLSYVEPSLEVIADSLASAHLRISADTLRRYHLSLKTRGFVVLAGVSGTGKTWLADAYAEAVGAERLIVPVAPNWTTNEDLLGYQNPLDNTYHDTEFSLFLRGASREWEEATAVGMKPRPFHLILDEMNLARVEYYFAKFLSAMELRARNGQSTVELAQGDVVQLTPNLRFVGTVNVDETTHGFADKVYDRSQLIELPIDRDAVLIHLNGRPYRDILVEVWQIFSSVAPFAFRVLDEIGAYADHAAALGVAWEVALDEQLVQKVLTKIKGTDLRLGVALTQFIDLTADRFPLSHAKATSMQHAFNEHGFTSYF